MRSDQYLLQGAIFASDQRRPELERYTLAEAAFSKAAAVRSILPTVRRSGTFLAATAEWMIADVPPGRPDKLRRAAERIKGLVDGDVRAIEVPILAIIARRAGDWERARWILARWGKDGPPSVRQQAEEMQPAIELMAHAYDRAIEEADKLLERSPDAEGLLHIRSEALKGLEAASKRFLQKRVGP